jgi:hypothetical protein
MKKSKFSGSQNVGGGVEPPARVSKTSFYKWKPKYSGMSVSELKRMRELEEENCRLKQMYANLSPEHEVLKDIIEKTLQVAERRELAHYAIEEHG